jgi:LPS-assembly lipoprotein
VAAVGASLFATACGFQLREPTNLPFRKLYAGFAPNSQIGAEFRSYLRSAPNIELVDRPEAAEVRLEVLREQREKEIVIFSSAGTAREYQLRLRFAFRLVDAKGRELIPQTELLQRREITTTDTQLVAKEQEDLLVYREMQQDMVQQLLRRLAAVRR